MREIKFRGFAKYAKTWIYGGIYYEFGNWWICPHNQSASWAVKTETVGQYTGLKDDKDREICEGDIIQFGSQMGSKNEVKFLQKNAGFLVKDKYGDWQWLYDVVASTNCVIIGNIHENPELL